MTVVRDEEKHTCNFATFKLNLGIMLGHKFTLFTILTVKMHWKSNILVQISHSYLAALEEYGEKKDQGLSTYRSCT
jgi:hypothetical protein